MPERIVNIFSNNDTFPVKVYFAEQDIEFTLRNLPGGEKYKTWNDCVTVLEDGSISMDLHLYVLKMLSKMIVSNPTTGGELTEEQIYNIHGDILSQLEEYVPKMGNVSTKKQELTKKVSRAS